MAGNEKRAAEGVAEIVFLVLGGVGRALIEIATVVENVVAVEFVDIPVKTAGAGFDFRFHSAGGVATILGSVVGSQHADFSDGINARIDVERVVAAVVHIVAAVHFPVVVFAAAAIDAVDHVAQNADGAFVLSGLVVHAGSEVHELSEISAVQLELGDFGAGDGAADCRGLGVHLRDTFAGDDYFAAERADLEVHVHAGLLSYAQDDAPGLKPFEALHADGNIVAADGEVGHDPVAILIGDDYLVDADARAGHVDFRTGDDGAGRIVHGTGERGGVLCGGDGCAEEKREQAASLAKKFHVRLQVARSSRGFCGPECQNPKLLVCCKVRRW